MKKPTREKKRAVRMNDKSRVGCVRCVRRSMITGGDDRDFIDVQLMASSIMADRLRLTPGIIRSCSLLFSRQWSVI